MRRQRDPARGVVVESVKSGAGLPSVRSPLRAQSHIRGAGSAPHTSGAGQVFYDPTETLGWLQHRE